MSPVIRKGVKLPFQLSICMWIDLLGYGSQISDANFNPLHIDAKSAIRRIKNFHEIIARGSSRDFPTLVMNDGAAAYRDLSYRSQQNTYDFLKSSCELFAKVQAKEKSYGYPGPRAVIAVGFRVLGRKVKIDQTTGLLQNILKKYRSGIMSAEQAILEAAQAQRKFDIVPQLQANFAFTKAYVAEGSGKANGIEGSNLYVDSAIFETEIPDWFEFDKIIDWKHPKLNLEAKFIKVSGSSTKNWPSMHECELRNGLDVAKFITKDDDILSKIKARINKSG